MSRLESTLELEHQVRRIEVITGACGRRRWTIDDKARIVEETLEPGASVSVVARRHGLTPQQVFALACPRFGRHRVRCFYETGGRSWHDGSMNGSSSLRL